MRPDFILKNVMVYQTFRQCFEKRDVAVAGEKFYCVSCNFISGSAGDRRQRQIHAAWSCGYPYAHRELDDISGRVFKDHASIWSNNGGCRCPRDGERVRHGRHPGFMAQKTKQDIFWAIPSSVPATNEKLETAGAALGVKEISGDGILRWSSLPWRDHEL